VPVPPRWLSDQGGRITGVRGRDPKVRHGRQELRVLWAVSHPGVLRWLGSTGTHQKPWPHVRQICRLERHRIPLRRGIPTGTASVETTYDITSLPPERATATRLLALIRGHRGIENRLHHVRDVTFDEDHSTVRSGAAPQVLAACRNLAIGLLRRHRCTNIAASLRTFAGRSRSAIDFVANCHRLKVK